MKNKSLKKKDLVRILSQKCPDFTTEDVEEIVNLVFEALTDALRNRRRIEIRGFGNFSIKQQKSREFINPKTGKFTKCPANYRIVFKAGKKMVEVER